MGAVKSKKKSSKMLAGPEAFSNSISPPQHTPGFYTPAVPVVRSSVPSRVLQHPWREIYWGNIQEDLEYVRNFQPNQKKSKHVRVLLYGPVGSGKSSFISSVSSVLRGRFCVPALANANNDESSFTKKYKVNKIQRTGEGSYYPLIFNDIMGLEEGNGRGVSVEDVKLILKGHVKDNYKFNPVSPLSVDDPYYNCKPSLDDRIHVLVWVSSANSAEVKDSVIQKMRAIREAASDMDIPQLALVTKVDEACGETEKDLKNVYMSRYLKEKMTDFSTALGIPLNCILPVKNYSEEIELKDDVTSLILSALRMMIHFGDDFINNTEATE